MDFFGKNLPRERTFCDIGAFDGVTFSNTRALYEEGWSGILVEPNPRVFEALKGNFLGSNRVVLVNAAVGDARRGEVAMLMVPDGGENDVYATCIPGEKGRFDFIKKWVEVEVVLRSLRSVLDEFGRPVEFLSVDAEGMDVEVLESGRFGSGERPQLVMVEHNQNRGGVRDLAKALLTPLGYEEVFYNHTNVAFGRVG